MSEPDWRDEMVKLRGDAGGGAGYTGHLHDRRHFNQLVARMRVRGDTPTADEVGTVIRAMLGPEQEGQVAELVTQHEPGS